VLRTSNFTRDYVFRNNSACDMDYGLAYTDAVPLGAVLLGATTLALPYDVRSPLRETFRQFNEFVTGVKADMRINPPWSPYMVACTQGCFQYYPYPVYKYNYTCIVDSAANRGVPGYGVQIWNTLYEACRAAGGGGSARCPDRRFLLVNSGQVYVEPTTYQRDEANDDNLFVGIGVDMSGWQIVSLDGASVVTSSIRIWGDASNRGGTTLPTWVTNATALLVDEPTPVGQNTICHATAGNFLFDAFLGIDANDAGTPTCPLLFAGISFFFPSESFQGGQIFTMEWHSGDTVAALIFYGCSFDGGGAEGAGVVNTFLLRHAYFRYCNFSNWNHRSVELFDLISVAVDHSYFWNNLGSSLSLSVLENVVMRRDRFVNCRGTPRGGSIIYLRGQGEAACRLEGADTQAWLGPGGSVAQFAGAQGNPCYIADVTQTVDAKDLIGTDYPDTFITLAWLNIPMTSVTDVGVQKTQYGMRFLLDAAVDSSDINLFFLLNPRCQPTLTRAVSPFVPTGSDVIGLSFGSALSGGFSFFGLFNVWQSDFPGDMSAQIAWHDFQYLCTVNRRYMVAAMPSASYDIVTNSSGTTAGPRYAYFQYGSLSDALAYCNDQRLVDNYLGLPAPMSSIYISIENGSRLYFENFTASRDVFIYGLDDPYSSCRYPVLESGGGNTLQDTRFYMQHVWMRMTDLAGASDDLLTSGENFLPENITLVDVFLDGGNAVPFQNIAAARLFVGTLFPTPSGVPVSLAPPRRTAAQVTLRNVTVMNFLYYDAEQLDALGFRFRDSSFNEFPYAEGVLIYFVNLVNSNTSLTVENCTFMNLDASGLHVHGVQNVSVFGTNFFNCTARARGNIACLWLDSNSGSQGPVLINITFTNITQFKDITFPNGPSRFNTFGVAGFLFTGFPNASTANVTFCFENNTCLRLPNAVRFATLEEITLASCLPPNDTEVFFPDPERFLRALALLNLQCEKDAYSGLHGTVHDLTYSWAGTALDKYRENIWCDQCCPPSPPQRCFIVHPVLDAELISPLNPWFGTYVFSSINQCLVSCVAPQRTCLLTGWNDPFQLNLGVPRVYNEAIDLTLLPRPRNVTVCNVTTAALLVHSLALSPMRCRNESFFDGVTRVVCERTALPGQSNWVSEASLMAQALNLTCFNETELDSTETTTLLGMSGATVCASGHRVDSPLGMAFVVDGVAFEHCESPNTDATRAGTDLATW
jgi:hypothetical protein